MGRVEEAMRRAAEQRRQDGTDAGARDEGPHVSGRLTPAPVEPFVSENTERPRLRPVGPASEVSALLTDVPRAAAPVTAGLPALSERIDADLADKVVINDGMDATCREQYRKMAATLHALQAESGMRVVMIASAMASEGKTLTAANLALTLSESYQRNVLLIDGDLRQPSQHIVFGVPPEPGLTEVVSGTDEQLGLHRVSPTLTVLPAGKPTHDPMATLASERMQQLIAEARESFDWVLIDTPPIGLLSDASLIASAADGTIIVVKAEATAYDLVQRAIASLGRERVIGVVLNLASQAPEGRYGAYYGHYASGQASSGKS